MQQVTTSTEASRRLIDRVAGHLSHPGLGGVPCDAGEIAPPGFQVEEEQDVIRDETAPGQNFDGEEIRSGKDTLSRTS
jgi:hypothetical protein